MLSLIFVDLVICNKKKPVFKKKFAHADKLSQYYSGSWHTAIVSITAVGAFFVQTAPVIFVGKQLLVNEKSV